MINFKDLCICGYNFSTQQYIFGSINSNECTCSGGNLSIIRDIYYCTNTSLLQNLVSYDSKY